jgi:hypothetical protein
VTLIYQPLVPITTPRRPLVGGATRHGNSAWTTSVRALRAVLIAARAHAPRERVPSSDELAELVTRHGRRAHRPRPCRARRDVWRSGAGVPPKPRQRSAPTRAV